MPSIYAQDALLISIINAYSTSDEQIPELVTDKPVQLPQVPVQTPSDEEADREVAAICKPSDITR